MKFLVYAVTAEAVHFTYPGAATSRCTEGRRVTSGSWLAAQTYVGY
jgi:hypothetical protein